MSVENSPQLPSIYTEEGELNAEVLDTHYGVSPDFAKQKEIVLLPNLPPYQVFSFI